MCLLSLFVLFYGYTGIHISNASGATDYKWTPHQLKSTMTEGFAWLWMDEDGFNNPEKPEIVDILIMGSSHMEAVNIDQSKNASSVLNALVPEYTVYNIGVSGHQIYQCANNLKKAVETYAPTRYIVVETDTVELNDRMMNQVISGQLQTIPSYESGLMYYIQKYCPAIKTIYKQTEDWRKADNAQKKESGSDATQTESELLSAFLEKMRSDCGAERKLIILYHPGTVLDAEGHLIAQNAEAVELFSSVCRQKDISFVDMTEDFQKLYEEQNILAHGFCNTGVGVGHLNVYGHERIAERLAKVIMEEPQ